MRKDDGQGLALERTVTASDAPAQPTAPPLDGRAELGRGALLGRYLVLEPRGAGGMGVVYVAYDPQLDRKIAIKLLKRDATADQSRLRREGQAMARLQHPNVVTVFDVGVFEDRIFVAMELVEGTTLSGWLEERPRSWREIVDVFAQAARGLSAAHAVNLVHRDFKPSNVLVGGDGRARVGDFGLARAVGDDEAAPPGELSAPANTAVLQETITRTGALLGTPTYMSPEQFRGQPADARSDQFSFCVALYRALWGERPFAGDDFGTIANEVLAGRLRPPPKDSAVPARVRAVVLRGLSTSPDARWPSMEALLEALRHDPARVRNRRIAVAAAAVALVGGVVGVRAAVGRDSQVCRGAERRFAAAWNGARQQKVRDAFSATKKPYAAQVADGVARALDAYGASWVSAETDACEATRVRREQSEELLDLRMECLGQRLREVEADVDLLERADGKIVEKAGQMTSALPAVTSCGDLAALRAPVRPPSDPAMRARVDDARRQIAKAKALTDAARYKDGVAVATSAVSVARAIGYRPLEAEALVQLGAAQYWSGDNGAAARTLEDAALAARAGRDFRTEASAWTLGIYVWFAKAQFEAAHAWGRYAFAALEAIGGGDDRLRADLLSNLGSVYDREGDYATALDYNTRALALREKAYAADDPAVAVAHEKLGHTLQNLGRHDEAEQHIRRALALLEARLGPAHPKVGTALFNIALVQVSERRYREALATYRRVLTIYENAFGPEHPNVGTVLLNMGDVEQELGEYEQALAYERRALALLLKANGPDHFDYAGGLINVGDALRMQKKYDEAAASYARATATLEKSFGPSHRLIASSLVGSALCAIGAGHPTSALKLLDRAIAICEANPGGQSDINEARFALARALWDSGRDRARARQEAAKARSGYVAEKHSEKQVAEIDAWLAAR